MTNSTIARNGGALALGLAAALALGAEEAKAQLQRGPVFQCPAASPPVTAVFPPGFDLRLLTQDHLRAVFRAAGPVVIPTEPVDCGFVNHDGTRNVVVRNPRVTVTEDLYAGISAWRQGGNGDLVVYVHGVDATGAPQHFHPIDHGRYAVRTMGDGEFNVGEESYGIWASHTGRGRVAIDFRDLSLSTAGGDAAHGIYATQQGSYFYENEKTHRSRGAVIVNVIETERDREGRVRPLIGTRGDESDAIRAEYTRAAAYGHIAITVKGYTIATGGIVPKGPQFPNNQGVPGVEPGPLLPSLNGYESRGIHARHEGLGDIRVAVTDSHILTWGGAAYGIFADHTGRSETITNLDRTTEVRTGGGAIDIDVTGGEIRTAGANSIGIHGWHRGAGNVAIDATGVTIATTGEEAHGILAHIRQATTTEGDRITGTETEVIPGTGEGDIAISVSGGAISTEGDGAFAVWGQHEHEGDIAISVSGGATVATAGAKTHGVFAEHQGAEGDVAVTIEGDSVAAAGESSDGVRAVQGGSGALVVVVSGGTVRAAGYQAHGIHALRAVNDEGRISVTVSGGSVVAEGSESAGVYVNGAGEAEVTIGKDGRVSAASGDGIFSNGPQDFTATVAGHVEGGIRATGAGAHRITVAAGGDVSGTVRVATRAARAETGSAVTIDGAVGRVHLDRGGALTVGPEGRIRGIDDEAIRSDGGDIDLLLKGSPVDYAARINGKIVATNGGVTVQFQPPGASGPVRLGRLGTTGAATDGAWDVGVEEAGNGIQVVQAYAPRARVYEALPSVLLGMNGPSRFQDRMAAQRDSRGAWGRVEETGGVWETEKAETSATYYTHRYRGVEVGMDAPVAGEDVLLGITAHHRRGSAEVTGDGKIIGGGEIDVSGTGFGVSGTWFRDGAYVDVTATTTWYKSDLASWLRGSLYRGVSAQGHALGVEAGRRLPLPGLSGEAALTPRIGLVHSRISMPAFFDAVGARVSLNDGRSLKGRVGASVETRTTGGQEIGRIFGSLDLEHETQDETRVTVSGSGTEATALTAAGRATWLRLGMGGTLQWGEGRVLRGTVGYATGGGGAYEYGAGLELKLGF